MANVQKKVKWRGKANKRKERKTRVSKKEKKKGS